MQQTDSQANKTTNRLHLPRKWFAKKRLIITDQMWTSVYGCVSPIQSVSRLEAFNLACTFCNRCWEFICMFLLDICSFPCTRFQIFHSLSSRYFIWITWFLKLLSSSYKQRVVLMWMKCTCDIFIRDFIFIIRPSHTQLRLMVQILFKDVKSKSMKEEMCFNPVLFLVLHKWSHKLLVSQDRWNKQGQLCFQNYFSFYLSFAHLFENVLKSFNFIICSYFLKHIFPNIRILGWWTTC